MENEEYRYCLKELLKRKTYPYSMANEEYAIYLWHITIYMLRRQSKKTPGKKGGAMD